MRKKVYINAVNTMNILNIKDTFYKKNNLLVANTLKFTNDQN